MRLFFSLALIGLFTSLSAQETINYPYNPDGDVDGAIASPDLLDLLGVYGGDFSPSEIQIDGVGLLQIIQDLQNQIGALQGEMLDADYVGSTFTALQQEVVALQAENATLTQQVQDLQNAGYATETWVTNNTSNLSGNLSSTPCYMPPQDGEFLGQLYIDTDQFADRKMWVWAWTSQYGYYWFSVDYSEAVYSGCMD